MVDRPDLEDKRRDVRRLLERLREPDSPPSATREGVVADLTTILYDDLRGVASAYLASERPGHSMSPADLVHEAYRRLLDQDRVNWQGRTHFLGIAAQAMRRLLVDHARRRLASKRGGDWKRVSLDDAATWNATDDLRNEQLLALDDALERLAEIDEREAKVVEMRYFVGMSVPEVADALGVARRTVDRDWTHARSWLKREIQRTR